MKVILNEIHYGHPEKSKEDTATLNDILARQGNLFALDVIVENCAIGFETFKLTEQERKTFCNSLIETFRRSLKELTQ